MILTQIILHGLFYAIIGTGYLFLFMITFNPRVWGYQDYPEAIKDKIPPQTRRERALAGIVGLPWFVFIIGFPFISTYTLKTQLEGEMPFEIAFLNIFVMVFIFFISDLVILDWIIISKITPQFVIIPGTEVEDYKDFSHHYKAHAKASIPLILICVVFAAIVVFM
ncbi:MAG: hypothetical protein ACXAEU_03560 [Candidatus Hodarchaeales archaeon]|jgi:hypothetical protein